MFGIIFESFKFIIFTSKPYPTRRLVFQLCTWTVLLFGILYINDANAQGEEGDSIQLSIPRDTSENNGGLESKVDYSADDSIRMDVPNKLVYLYGNARIKYEDMDLQAEYIVVDFGKRTLFAKGIPDSSGNTTGRPYFKNNDQEVTTDSLAYNFDTKRGRMIGVRMQEGEGYIQMNKVYRSEEGHIFSDKGYYTTCNHEHPHFYLRTRKLKLIPNDKIVFGPSNLYIEGIPTPLALPFGIFPTKQGRKSGIVFPEFGTEVVRGFNIRNFGYYFGISDRMDLLLSGDFYFRGSWAARIKSRYAKRYKRNGQLEFHYNRNILGEQEDASYNISRDFKILWTHRQDPKARPGTTFNSTVDIRSSDFAINNELTAQNIVQNEFSSSINYSKSFAQGKMNLSVGGLHRQNTQTHDITVSLPNINYSLSRVQPFERKNNLNKKKWYERIGFSYNANFENRVTTKDSFLFRGEAWDEFKLGMTHSIPLSTTMKIGYFTLAPSISWTDYWYLETIDKFWDPSDSTVGINEIGGFKRGGNLSTGASLTTRVFGTYQFTKSEKLVAMRHVLTPNIGFSYQPGSEQYYKTVQSTAEGQESTYSIFEQGIKGGPGRNEFGSITFGLNNNLELKTKKGMDTGVVYNYHKLIEAFTLSGNYNLLADSLNLSNISANLRTTLFKKLTVSMRGTYDPYIRDSSGTRLNTFELNKNGRLARFTYGQIMLNTSLSPDDFKKGKKKENRYNSPLPYYYYYDVNFVDFNIPWTVNFGYNLDYRPNADQQYQHNLSFQGDVKLTDNWKIGYNSGYVLHEKQWSFTEFSIHRSLHCWQISFRWIPTGFRQSFTFMLSPKSTMLQDLKLNKRKSFVDLNNQF